MKKRTNAYVSSGGSEYKKRLGSEPPLLPLATTVRIVHTWHAKPSGYTAKLKKNTHSHTRGNRPFRPFVHYRGSFIVVYILYVCVCMCVYCVVFVTSLVALKISRNLKPFFFCWQNGLLLLYTLYIYYNVLV